MKKTGLFEKYTKYYAVSEKWRLISGYTENISQVVVIPAFAEREMIFSTLLSLAGNRSSYLDQSFIICVINNKKNANPEVKENNRETLEYLHALVCKKGLISLNPGAGMRNTLEAIADAPLRLGYIDASSSGLEIPDAVGGVGMARKIGMDMALRLLMKDSSLGKQILSLDADTLVRNDYLAAIRASFDKRTSAAVIAYEHQEPESDEEKAAIYCYEIFLRYWILGLRYAKSPYAFHTIGSAMACSADAYLSVRGMNRREAGEDFYFLNKLAKISGIKYVRNTCVYPSARASLRVPFGTGKRIQRFLDGGREEYVLYNPRIFQILASWLEIMKNNYSGDDKDILKKAAEISPELSFFLKNMRFFEAWGKIRGNIKNENDLIKHFHCWFDGFRTLKLINYLSASIFPPVNMFSALETVLKAQEICVPEFYPRNKQPNIQDQKKIVQYLREIT